MRGRFWSGIKVYLRPFTSFRFLLSFGVAWMLTNGWAYLIAFAPLGLPEWIVWFSRWYIGFLYLPWTPEKLVTIPMAIWFHIRLFKNDDKTHKQLQDMYSQAKADWQSVKIQK